MRSTFCPPGRYRIGRCADSSDGAARPLHCCIDLYLIKAPTDFPDTPLGSLQEVHRLRPFSWLGQTTSCTPGCRPHTEQLALAPYIRVQNVDRSRRPDHRTPETGTERARD